MARQVHGFSVTVPTGTTASNPQTFDLALPTLPVDEVRVRVPPGPSGQVGFALLTGGGQIIPYEAGTFLVADNEVLDFPLTDFPESGDWGLLAYNMGAFPHTLQVLFYLAAPVTPAPVTPQPITAGLLAPS